MHSDTHTSRRPKLQPCDCHSHNTDTYIEALDGSFTVVLLGVVHKRTLIVQQHLYAVNCPNSERNKQVVIKIYEVNTETNQVSQSVIEEMGRVVYSHLLCFELHVKPPDSAVGRQTSDLKPGGQTEVAHLLKSSWSFVWVMTQEENPTQIGKSSLHSKQRRHNVTTKKNHRRERRLQGPWELTAWWTVWNKRPETETSTCSETWTVFWSGLIVGRSNLPHHLHRLPRVPPAPPAGWRCLDWRWPLRKWNKTFKFQDISYVRPVRCETFYLQDRSQTDVPQLPLMCCVFSGPRSSRPR